MQRTLFDAEHERHDRFKPVFGDNSVSSLEAWPLQEIDSRANQRVARNRRAIDDNLMHTNADRWAVGALDRSGGLKPDYAIEVRLSGSRVGITADSTQLISRVWIGGEPTLEPSGEEQPDH